MVSNNPAPQSRDGRQIPKKLWIYTNYDCNLSCTYCVAESSPTAARRALAPSIIQRLVDEAQALEFDQIYFTGGEPFLLKEIFDLLEYSSILTQRIMYRITLLPNPAKMAAKSPKSCGSTPITIAT
jgi:MoaA/NifB/PqqE/SkfB family radical SAM enzyme